MDLYFSDVVIFAEEMSRFSLLNHYLNSEQIIGFIIRPIYDRKAIIDVLGLRVEPGTRDLKQLD